MSDSLEIVAGDCRAPLVAGEVGAAAVVGRSSLCSRECPGRERSASIAEDKREEMCSG